MRIEMKRREFLGGLFVGAAGSLLPAYGKNIPSAAPEPSGVFACRGRYERLAVSMQRLHIGIERPFSFLHISDTHFTAAYDDESDKKQQLKAARTRTFGGLQEQALVDSLAWAQDHSDFVLHTGDLIDFQSRANFDLVRKHCGGVFGCLGNHEYSQNMWLGAEEPTEAYRDQTRPVVAAAYPFDIVFATKIFNGVNFIALDNVYGMVNERQVDLFRDEVKKGLPIVLAAHCPFFSDDLWRIDRKFWGDRRYISDALPPPADYFARQRSDALTRQFIADLKREPLLKAIAVGHMHISIVERFSATAIQYVVGPNFLFQGREFIVD